MVVMLAIIGAVIVFMLEHQRKMARILRGEKVDEGADLVTAIMSSGAKDPDNTKALESRIEQLERTVFELQANASRQELPSIGDRLVN